MNNKEFLEWAEFHRALFAMRSEDDVAMTNAWWPSLHSFPLCDCMDSSREMAERNPPAYRDKHLSRLLESLGGKAMRRRQAEYEESVAEAPECKDCLGTGLVIVPHVRFVQDGEWVRSGKSFTTMSVSCACIRGQRIEQGQRDYCEEKARQQKRSKVEYGWTLKSYVLRVPHWRQLMADQTAAAKRERESEAQAAHLDKRHGPLDVAGIKARLAKRFKVPG